MTDYGLPDPVAEGKTYAERLDDWRGKADAREAAFSAFQQDEEDRPRLHASRPYLWSRGYSNANIDAVVEARLRCLDALDPYTGRWLGIDRMADLPDEKWMPVRRFATNTAEGVMESLQRYGLLCFVIAEAEAIRFGRVEPKDLDQLIELLREEADQVYAKHGLPTGKPVYKFPDSIRSAPALVALADNPEDEALILAGKLHLAILHLEASTRADRLDLTMVVRHAMDVERARAAMFSVAAVRGDSGLPLAETVRKGVDQRKGELKRSRKGADTRKKSAGHDDYVNAARSLLSKPANQQMSMQGCISAMAGQGFETDDKTVRKWLKGSGLFVRRERGQGYRPSPDLYS